MRKVVSLAIIIFVCDFLHAQSNTTPVFLNHVYLVLDSDSYRHIFDSAFLKQIGAESDEKSTTAAGSWSGKYFNGLDSYLEIFPPGGYAGATPGNFGLGLMTFNQGDIERIKRYWQEHSKDSLSVDTTTWVSDSGKKTPWFYSVSKYQPDSLSPFNVWVMENTIEDLKAAGFTDEEIKKPISWKVYMEKISGKKFTKSFTRITAIDMLADPKAYKYLEHSLVNIGLQRKRHDFYNDYITIRCTKAQILSPQLKKITIELDKTFEERTVALNDHLVVHIKGKSATFNFN